MRPSHVRSVSAGSADHGARELGSLKNARWLWATSLFFRYGFGNGEHPRRNNASSHSRSGTRRKPRCRSRHSATPRMMAEDPRPGRDPRFGVSGCNSSPVSYSGELAGFRGSQPVRAPGTRGRAARRATPFLMRSGLPDGHHVQAVVVRAGPPNERRRCPGARCAWPETVRKSSMVRLGGGDVYECHDCSTFPHLRFVCAGIHDDKEKPRS